MKMGELRADEGNGTHPYHSVQLGHGDLFRPLDCGQDLLLVLLRQERYNLGDYCI